jgi:Putative MetA-pathway of phenol degradation
MIEQLAKKTTLSLFALSFGFGCCVELMAQDITSSVVDSQTAPSFFNSRFRRDVEDPGTLFSWSEDGEVAGLDEPIVTDRPDFTEASSVVGRGVIQLETGYTYSRDSQGSVRTHEHSIGEPLLRVGAFRDWLELRLGWNYAAEDISGATHDGGEDLYLGCKIGLTPQAGFLPEVAIVPQMTVPTGANSFTSSATLPGCNVLYGWDLSDSLATGGSTQFNRAVDGGSGSEYTEWAQSWTIGYSLSERLGAYTEWYALFPDNAETDPVQHYFNGGFTFLVNDDVQWDIRSGVGLNESANDFFVGTGLSFRVR